MRFMAHPPTAKLLGVPMSCLVRAEVSLPSSGGDYLVFARADSFPLPLVASITFATPPQAREMHTCYSQISRPSDQVLL